MHSDDHNDSTFPINAPIFHLLRNIGTPIGELGLDPDGKYIFLQMVSITSYRMFRPSGGLPNFVWNSTTINHAIVSKLTKGLR